MYDLPSLDTTAEGQSNHHHDHPEGSASHDDRCIAPPRTFSFNSGDWYTFYGFGATHGIQHGDQTAHDDSCLVGNGCVGLGLSPDQAEKDMPTDALQPASGVNPMAADVLESQHAEAPRKAYELELDLLGATSASMLSQASVSQSPMARRRNDSFPDDVGTEADACSSCDSRCPGSEGPCSADSCAPCPPCGPCGMSCTRPDQYRGHTNSDETVQTS